MTTDPRDEEFCAKILNTLKDYYRSQGRTVVIGVYLQSDEDNIGLVDEGIYVNYHLEEKEDMPRAAALICSALINQYYL